MLDYIDSGCRLQDMGDYNVGRAFYSDRWCTTSFDMPLRWAEKIVDLFRAGNIEKAYHYIDMAEAVCLRMRGEYYAKFYSGGEEYEIRTEDSDLYTRYLIYEIRPYKPSNKLIHTAYSKDGAEAYMRDIYIVDCEYNLGI